MKKKHLHGGTISLNTDNSIVIKILDFKVLRILSRSLFLTMILVALPFLGTIFNGFSLTSSSHSFGSLNLKLSSQKRKLCELASDAKLDALNGLEDVLLEPPRQSSYAESKNYLKNFKYLPDLLDDSLEGYNRRLFIGVGLNDENKGVIEWFEHNYPKKNTKFEIHSLLVATKDQVLLNNLDVSDWLLKHVKEEEYVVMKAEVEIVEEMIEKRTICLVDELFLECKNEWWKRGERKKRIRAYWECLALYGKLRDEGVAVHQWWG